MREDGALLMQAEKQEEQEEVRWGGLGRLIAVPDMLVGQAGRKLLRGPPQAPLFLDLPAPSGPGEQDTVMPVKSAIQEEEEAMGGTVEGEGG